MLSKLYSQNIGKRSVIRECFEYSKQRAAIVGTENVFDFSIGNPSVPPPPSVDRAIENIMKNLDPIAAHGYPSAEGDPSVRAKIAENLNKKYGTDYTVGNIFMSTGAAAALGICFNSLTDRGEGDEIITFAPFFPEYTVFVQSAGAKLVVIPADIDSFQINFEEFEKAINEHTKAVLINSPNNPCGVVYSEDTIKRLAAILEKKQQEYGRSIYIISDEPYREIVFKGFEVPYVPNYYDNTLVCYSYSKSLSIPGERIGYIAFTNKAKHANILLGVLAAAARSMTYVGVPMMFQQVIKECDGLTSDTTVYETNKNILYKGLTELGYTCVEPGGTFYAFPRSLEPDAAAFCEKARKYDLVLVPGDGFGCPGHFRIAYCTDTDKVVRSLEKFKLLAEEYGVKR